MSIDVSVVVPFFNPGANIEDCLASLVAQTLPRSRWEAVLVDDGSTDGSEARAAAWAARHPELFTVTRIEASGGPARPRNVGIGLAQGRYIQFLDSDDTLAPRALERQLEVGDSSAADVVVGKLASDFRGIWQPLFRTTVTGRTLADYPLIQNLTVCKMFRRAFLDDHQIRFPEGPHYIEDQQICIQAYAHATSVAVVADLVCYFYRRRRVGGRNFGDTTIDPVAYYRELAEIFDVIDTQVAPAARDSSFARYLRGEMLGRLRGPAMLDYEPTYREQIFHEVQRLIAERIPAVVPTAIPVFPRVQAELVRADDLDGLLSSARWMETLRLAASGEVIGWQDGRLLIDIDAYLRVGDEPLRLERGGSDWLLPTELAPTVPIATRRLGDLAAIDVDLATISRADGQVWSTTAGLAMTVDDDGVPRVRCQVTVDPATVMGGAGLSPGLWDFRLRVMAGGLTRTSAVRAREANPTPPPTWLSAGGGSVQPYWTDNTVALALDVDEWLHELQVILRDATVTVDGRKGLTVTTDALVGPVDSARPATVILTPGADDEEAAVQTPAELTISPSGSVLTAAVPALPKRVDRWEVWTRLVPAGSTPAVQLPVAVSAGRFGKVTLTEPPSDAD